MKWVSQLGFRGAFVVSLEYGHVVVHWNKLQPCLSTDWIELSILIEDFP